MKGLEYQLKNIEKQMQATAHIKDIMTNEGERLKAIIQGFVDAYYASYTPKEYERTYNFKRSLRIDPVKVIGNEIVVRIYFDEELAYHPSVMGGSPGYVPLLYNDGWAWANTTGPYRFAFYEGFNFIEKAVEEYNAHNPYNIELKVIKRYMGVDL